MRIKYSDGSSVYAWIMSLAGGVMRVAVRGADDVLELTLSGDSWYAEGGKAVTFDFPWIREGALRFLNQLEQMTADQTIRQACGGSGECLLRQLLTDQYAPRG